MPVAAFFFSHAYGPAAAAMVAQADTVVVAGLSATAQAASVVQGAGSVPLAKATRLVNSPMTVTATSSMPLALPKARARAGAVVRVNELSQDDITGGVLTAPVEGSLTIRDVLRLLLAVAAGKTDIATGPTVVTFRDQADTKNRVSATMTGSERASITLDPS